MPCFSIALKLCDPLEKPTWMMGYQWEDCHRLTIIKVRFDPLVSDFYLSTKEFMPKSSNVNR